MKAWFVYIGDEWGDFVHGETATKAKSMFWHHWEVEAEEWIQMRPIRVPALDNISLTSTVIKNYIEENYLSIDYAWFPWTVICMCSLCRNQKAVMQLSTTSSHVDTERSE